MEASEVGSGKVDVGTAKLARFGARSALIRVARAGAGVGAVLAMLGGAAAASVDGEGERDGSGSGSGAGRGARLGTPSRGGTIVIDREQLVAFAADADNKAIHRVDLVSGEASTTSLECAPEQIALLGGGRLSVALRGCSKVALLQVNEAGDASVLTTRDVPADPWGLAATPDGALLVTSAWGGAVTALDAESLDVRWSVEVGREPRSVTVSRDGARAFVTHVAGDALTILDLDRGAARGGPPPIRRLAAFGGAYRRQVDRAIGVSPAHRASALAYASVLSESGSRLFVPHLLTQNGSDAGRAVSSPGSYGGVAVEQDTTTASVAVIATWLPTRSRAPDATEPASSPYGESVIGVPVEPAPVTAKQASRAAPAVASTAVNPIDNIVPLSTSFFRSVVAAPPAAPARQARAAAVLGGSLFVASLGTNELCELDARAIDPAMSVLRTFAVGDGPTGVDVDPATGIAVTWNQLSHDVSIVSLGSGVVETIPVASDPLPPAVSAGRRLFYTEIDRRIARDGRACAACHPDGRDDGIVWGLGEGLRQTPTLIGRAQRGPFGWVAKHARLEDNIRDTMTRLGGTGLPTAQVSELAAYLRALPAPHRGAASPLSKEEARGRDLFVSAEVGCGSCHALDQEASDRRLHDVASRAKSDEGRRFRTPPLLFLAGTAPYFHDGRYPTLEALLEDNLDRMGSTTHLSDADLAALAAFLRTL